MGTLAGSEIPDFDLLAHAMHGFWGAPHMLRMNARMNATQRDVQTRCPGHGLGLRFAWTLGPLCVPCACGTSAWTALPPRCWWMVHQLVLNQLCLPLEHRMVDVLERDTHLTSAPPRLRRMGRFKPFTESAPLRAWRATHTHTHGRGESGSYVMEPLSINTDTRAQPPLSLERADRIPAPCHSLAPLSENTVCVQTARE